MNFQNASARAIGDLHWCISFLCQATPLLMWNFRIICFTETIIESKKWWHTKTTMSAKCWWSPRRASTCCSSTSPGITRWSGEPHSSITERENCSGMRSTMSSRHVAPFVSGDQGRERGKSFSTLWKTAYMSLYMFLFLQHFHRKSNLLFQTSLFLLKLPILKGVAFKTMPDQWKGRSP